AKIAAGRGHALWRRLEHLHEPRARKSLLDLRYLRRHLLAHEHEGHEDDEVLHPRHTFTPEGDVSDGQDEGTPDVEGSTGRDNFGHACILTKRCEATNAELKSLPASPSPSPRPALL